MLPFVEGTGTTRHRENGGVIEKRKLLSRTKVRGATKIYYRTQDQLMLDEIERIVI